MTELGGVGVGTSFPADPVVGQLFWHEAYRVMYVWDPTVMSWVEVETFSADARELARGVVSDLGELAYDEGVVPEERAVDAVAERLGPLCAELSRLRAEIARLRRGASPAGSGADSPGLGTG